MRARGRFFENEVFRVRHSNWRRFGSFGNATNPREPLKKHDGKKEREKL
jgi:hypothetical protein